LSKENGTKPQIAAGSNIENQNRSVQDQANNTENNHPPASKLSEVEKLRNGNRALKKKIETLENMMSSRGIEPTELEKRVAKAEAELQTVVYENSHMASVIGGLYKSRKNPNTNEEYAHIVRSLKAEIKTLEQSQTKFQKLLADNQKDNEKLGDELSEEKKKHGENRKKLEDQINKINKDNENKIRELKEKEESRVKKLEEQISTLREELDKKTREAEDLLSKYQIEQQTVDQINAEKKKMEERIKTLEYEIKNNAELLKKYKDAANETKEDKKAEQISEEEYVEMNKMLGTFLKERRLPTGPGEQNTLIEKYKRENNILRNKIADTDKTEQFKKTIDQQKKEIEKLKKQGEENLGDIAKLKELVKKVKAEKKEAEEVIKSSRENKSGNNTDEELEQMSSLLASFIKERRQPYSNSEADHVLRSAKDEIARLKRENARYDESTRVRELEEKLSEMSDIRTRSFSMESEIKSMTEIIKNLKKELEEKSKNVTGASDKKEAATPENISQEFEEMNGLISSFLKERKLPTGTKEVNFMAGKYKKEIASLREKLSKKDETTPILKKELEERENEIGELKKSTLVMEEEKKRMKELVQKMKTEIEEYKNQLQHKAAGGADPAFQKEFDEMSMLVSTLIKDRKMPSGEDESSQLIEQYKNQIKKLKNELFKEKNNPVERKLNEEISELKEEIEKLKKAQEQKEEETSHLEVLDTLKKQIKELETKLTLANNKLSLYGEDIIE